MRRENSKFNVSFASYAGSKLYNNDYFGSAEMEGFACYVIADGLEQGDVESESARIAVQAAISSFYEAPSLKPRALKRYVKAAHEALRKNVAHRSLRASVTVVVTDYQSARFAWAGNTRFYLYRTGRILRQSLDHSLSQQMASKGNLALDKVAQHEERGNLSRYAGQPKKLAPQVSKKIKLQDGDIFVLLTRGVWERCDEGDVRAALESAENDPKLAVDGLESLMLAPGPEDMDNYTAAAVFIDKIYTDPNKGKKLKRTLMIAIPVFVIAAIVATVLIIQHNRNVAKRQDMNSAFFSAVEYIEDENYVRASTELITAHRLSGELKDKGFKDKCDAWRKLVDAILNADSLFSSGDYNGAQAAYLLARDRSRFTDNAGKSYVDRKLTTVGGYLSVRDLIALGDTLYSAGNYLNAESKYLEARLLASGISDVEGRRLAMDALNGLYLYQDRDEALRQDAAAQEDRNRREGAEMETAGDKAVADKDMISARLYYDIARERFMALDDADSLARVDGKLVALSVTQAQNQSQTEAAAAYTAEGDRLFDAGRYVDAKVNYILARNIYSRLQDTASLIAILTKIDMCDSRIGVTR